ncbi:MAG: TSUP family transporter [Bacteroidetes bacterium]|nr:TSUP family transporter [Bacteroidota bacterium]
MDVVFFCLVAAGLSGGFVNGFAGFGTALFALGWVLQVMPPQEAVAVILVCSLFVGIPGLWHIRRSIFPRRVLRFLLPAFPGLALGFVVLDRVDATTLTVLIGVIMLIYGIYFLAGRTLPAITGNWFKVEMGIGFLGGVLGVLGGLSGALPSMWVALRSWPKAEQRGVLQPYNMTVLALATVLVGVGGGFNAQVMAGLIVALPTSVVGAVIGLWLFRRTSDKSYRRLLIILMLLSGVSLLIRPLIG